MKCLVVFVGAFLLVYEQPALANEATNALKKLGHIPTMAGSA